MGIQQLFQLLLLLLPYVACMPALLTRRDDAKQCEAARYTHKPRTFVLSDISNEPDDQMSLVRLLTYSNELDINGIGVITSWWKNDSIDVDTVHEVLGAYGQVRDNLNANVPAYAPYPTADELLAKVEPGHPVYGLAALSLPPSEAALALVAAADNATRDDDLLYVTLWGGAAALAEALQHVSQTRPAYAVDEFVARLRVYSISDQDDAGIWIRRTYPKVFYVVSLHGMNEYTQASWNGISGELYRHFDKGGPDTSLVTNDWLEEHIRVGTLGAYYPNYTYIMEGDTPSYFPLIRNGLGDPSHPEWGSWGGRYLLVDKSDRYPLYSDSSDVAIGINDEIYVSSFAAIWRWRQAYQHDFAARMQWTLSGDYSTNNHAPVVVMNGSCGPDAMEFDFSYGDSVVIDATDSWDPDGDDLSFSWFHYREVVDRMQEGTITKVSTDVNFTSLDSTGGLVQIHPTNKVSQLPDN
jgi:hypothetical protein